MEQFMLLGILWKTELVLRWIAGIALLLIGFFSFIPAGLREMVEPTFSIYAYKIAIAVCVVYLMVHAITLLTRIASHSATAFVHVKTGRMLIRRRGGKYDAVEVSASSSPEATHICDSDPRHARPSDDAIHDFFGKSVDLQDLQTWDAGTWPYATCIRQLRFHHDVELCLSAMQAIVDVRKGFSERTGATATVLPFLRSSLFERLSVLPLFYKRRVRKELRLQLVQCWESSESPPSLEGIAGVDTKIRKFIRPILDRVALEKKHAREFHVTS